MSKILQGSNTKPSTKRVIKPSKATVQKQIQSQQDAKIQELITGATTNMPLNEEVQRILSILDEAIEKAKIAQFLDSEFFDLADKSLEGIVSKEWITQLSSSAQQLIKKEIELEQKITPMLGKRPDSTNGESFSITSVQNVGEPASIAAKNYRNLIREVQKSPKDLEIIRRLKEGLGRDETQWMINYLKGIRLLVFKRLNQFPEEEKSQEERRES